VAAFLYGLPDKERMLEKLGMEPPATDEWYSVLKAFKESNVNGRGDVIPFGVGKRPRSNILPCSFMRHGG
jgi:ABC-type glycerol-3-phosphate transport system substrate-binding protein